MMRLCARAEGFEVWVSRVHTPTQAEHGDTLPCFSSHAEGVLFCDLPRATFPAILCSLLAISLFKTAPECSAEVLSRVPKGRKTVMGLMKKIHVRPALFRCQSPDVLVG